MKSNVKHINKNKTIKIIKINDNKQILIVNHVILFEELETRTSLELETSI